MKKLIVFVVIVAALGSAGWAYYAKRNRPEPTVTTMPVSLSASTTPIAPSGTENMMMNGSRSDSYCDAITA